MGIKHYILVVFFCIGIQTAIAEVYQWVDKNGRKQFSDRPPPSQKKNSPIKPDNVVFKMSQSQKLSPETDLYQKSIILKVRKLLQQKKFDELNQLLESYQVAFEANVNEEDHLFTAYDAFKIKGKLYESLIQEWINATPNNYQPYMARAKFNFHFGASLRGSNWASETKKSQLTGMDSYFNKAVIDIEKALDINNKFLVGYYTLIGIANMQGKDGCHIQLISVENNTKHDEILQVFKSETQSRNLSCEFLVIQITNSTNQWVIAGFNDEKQFQRLLIDNTDNKILLELKKETINKSTIIKLVAEKLGRTLEVDQEKNLVKKALDINPLSYKIRSIYINALTPRWGGSYEQMQKIVESSLVYVLNNPRLKLLEGFIYAEAADMQSLIKKYNSAEKLYTKALIFGNNHKTLKERGVNRYKKESYQDALIDLHRAIELYHEDGMYYFWRSKIYGKLHDYNKATLDVERASLLQPDNELIQKQRKWLVSKLRFQGYELNKHEKPKEAIDEYEAALRLDPNDADLYYRKANALIKKNQLDLAIINIKKAIGLDANELNYYLLLDWSLAKRKDWNQIIQYWDQYILLNPNNSRAYVERGGAYYHKGDMNSAIKNAKIAADMGSIEGKDVYEKFKHRRVN